MIQNVQAGMSAAEFLAMGAGRAAPATDFAALLAGAKRHDAPVRAGRLGIEMMPDGQRIARVTYHSDSGALLATSVFDPVSLLETSRHFGIDRENFRALGEALDAAGIGYRPYALYPGTGSNHGIDLADLADGGLGTVYDWTEDPFAHLKGPSALYSLAHARAVAQACGVRRPAAEVASAPAGPPPAGPPPAGPPPAGPPPAGSAAAPPASAPALVSGGEAGGAKVSPADTAAGQIEALLEKIFSQSSAASLDLIARRIADRLAGR